jgi:hypothetical protein
VTGRYLADNFRPALVTNYACAHGSPCNSARFAVQNDSAQYSWQRSVVVDPRLGLGYHGSLIAQAKRKLAVLPAFQGLVVDRSDWNQMVNLDGKWWFTRCELPQSFFSPAPAVCPCTRAPVRPGARASRCPCASAPTCPCLLGTMNPFTAAIVGVLAPFRVGSRC